jgi:hypothetical protein
MESSITRYMPTISTSGSFAKLASALAKAQGQFEPIAFDQKATIKTKSGGSYSYEYASRAAINKATKKALSDNGIAVMSIPTTGNSGMIDLVTLVMFEDEWIESRVPLLQDTSQPQLLASQISYLMRYCKSAMLDISTEKDDDANIVTSEYDRGRQGNKQDMGREPGYQKPQKREVRSFTEQVQDHFANLVKDQGEKAAPARGIWGATVGIIDGMVEDTSVRMRVLSLLTGRAIESSNDLSAQEKNALLASVKPMKDEGGDWVTGNDRMKPMVDRLLEENPQPQEEENDDSSDA